jgi:hypothetical protein
LSPADTVSQYTTPLRQDTAPRSADQCLLGGFAPVQLHQLSDAVVQKQPDSEHCLQSLPAACGLFNAAAEAGLSALQQALLPAHQRLSPRHCCSSHRHSPVNDGSQHHGTHGWMPQGRPEARQSKCRRQRGLAWTCMLADCHVLPALEGTTAAQAVWSLTWENNSYRDASVASRSRSPTYRDEFWGGAVAGVAAASVAAIFKLQQQRCDLLLTR